MQEELKFEDVLENVFGSVNDLLSKVDGRSYKSELWVREFSIEKGYGLYVLYSSYESCGNTIIYKYVFSDDSVKAVLDSTMKYAEEHHFSDLPYETVGEIYINSIREIWKAKDAVLKIFEDEFEHLLDGAKVGMWYEMTDKVF